MKKLVFGMMFFLAGNLYASIKVGGYEVMRATEVSGAISNFQVATGSVYLHGFTVSSGNINSTFQYRNSSTTATSGSTIYTTYASSNNIIASVIPSTSIVYQVPTAQGDFVYIGDYLAEGFNITTTGTSHIRILWDFINNIPAGQNKKGFRR